MLVCVLSFLVCSRAPIAWWFSLSSSVCSFSFGMLTQKKVSFFVVASSGLLRNTHTHTQLKTQFFVFDSIWCYAPSQTDAQLTFPNIFIVCDGMNIIHFGGIRATQPLAATANVESMDLSHLKLWGDEQERRRNHNKKNDSHTWRLPMS